MSDSFIAECAIRGDAAKGSLNLNVTLVNEAGGSELLSLTPAAVAELASILKDHMSDCRCGDLARIPNSFSIGHGRYERVVLLRFEDDVAYGLEPELALELAEALSDELSNIETIKFPARQ